MQETCSALARSLIGLAVVALVFSFGFNLTAFAQTNRQVVPNPPVNLSTSHKLFREWQEELRVFFSNPNAKTLNQLVLAANECLNRPSSTGTTAYVTYWMAMAFGQGVALRIDKDFDRCKEYCERAMQCFASASPIGDWNLKDWQWLRNSAHAMCNFYIAFCLIEAGESDDLAIDYLTRSTQAKGDNYQGWKYSSNYWFRAHIYQKQYDELKKLRDESPGEEKTREKGKEIPWKLNSLVDKIIADCARTVATAPEHLKYFQEEAREMLRKYWRINPGTIEQFIDRFRDDPTIGVKVP